MALKIASKVLERAIREVIKRDGVNAGIALGKQLNASKKVVFLAINRASKKNPYGTFAQRKADRMKEAAMARSNPMVRRNAPFDDDTNMLLKALREVYKKEGKL